jgi:hypothetical protein
MSNKKLNTVVEKFLKWKSEHPDKDYQYDEIPDFFSTISRSDMLDFMNKVSDENTIVVWKDGTFKYTNNVGVYEYENDENWLATIPSVSANGS